MEQAKTISHFWAKTTEEGRPGISVTDHGLNVGCVADALLKTLPVATRALLPSGAATMAALHDIGKVCPGFQQVCPAWLTLDQFQAQEQEAEADHAKVTQWFLQQWLGPESPKLRAWIMALGAHHGQSQGVWIQDGLAEGTSIGWLGGPEWQRAREWIANTLVSFFTPGSASPSFPNLPPANDAVLAFLAGLVTVADWIASDEHFFSPAAESPPLRAEERRGRAASAVAAAGFKELPHVHGVDFESLFPEIEYPNTLQQYAGAHCHEAGLWIVEAPMGHGKTEAALLAAARACGEGHARGLYFALPSPAASHRVHERVGRWMDRLWNKSATPRLAHEASWLDEKQIVQVHPSVGVEGHDVAESPWAADGWFASARRALLAPLGVGPLDEALAGVVAAKHFFVRPFGLAGKVVVLDEIHSYDLHTSTLLDLLIEQLVQLRCVVIVLSATLTQRCRQQLLNAARRAIANGTEPRPAQATAAAASVDAYPLLTGLSRAGKLLEIPINPNRCSHQSVRIRCCDLDFAETAAECARRAETGQVVLWIRNTVDAAQQSFAAVRSVLGNGGPEVALLHSRFPWFRRDELEAHWLARLGRTAANRPDGAVVVATQVAEQSTDIDADFLVTDLAPTDMLLQRLGRLWRHVRPDRPNGAEGAEAWIHSPDCEGLSDLTEVRARLQGFAPPYAASVLLRSAREWQRLAGRGGIQMPNDIAELLEATYAPTDHEPELWRVLHAEMIQRADQLGQAAVAGLDRWKLPTSGRDEDIPTRFADYPTLTLILLEALEVREGEAGLIGLDGSSAIARERDWSRAVAVVLQRNHVRVPAWWFGGRAFTRPSALQIYFNTAWALATVSGEDAWLDGQENCGLKYLPDRGLWHEASPGQPPSPDYP